jgi:uncharacterized protein
MRYIVATIIIALVVAAVALISMPKLARTNEGPSVTVGTTTFSVELAETPEQQALGLGQRDSLPEGHGMLFVFPQAANWGFWMKDTRFPLDMLWARSDGTIISIARNVATSTYAQQPPEIFYPASPDALYVLEVNAGAAAGIEPGQKMTITF